MSALFVCYLFAAMIFVKPAAELAVGDKELSPEFPWQRNAEGILKTLLVALFTPMLFVPFAILLKLGVLKN